MLCSPIAPAVAASNQTGTTTNTRSTMNGGGGKVPLVKQKQLTNSSNPLNVHVATSNNNSLRQQNFEMVMQSEAEELKGADNNNTLIREIKSRNIGSLSPLVCQSVAANLNSHHHNHHYLHHQQQQQQQRDIASSNATSNGSTTTSYPIERRQAFSMERLNNISTATNNTSPTGRYLSQIHSNNLTHHHNHLKHYHNHNIHHQQQQQQQQQHGNRVTNSQLFINSKTNSPSVNGNSGSLSSGSNSSIDESASDAERQHDQFNIQLQQQFRQMGASNKYLVGRDADQQDDKSSGLSRSASRVSRFRSAKEFFERLSSVNSNATSIHQQQQQQTIVFRATRQSPERVRSSSSNGVASRYTNPLAASLTQVTTTTTTAGSPLKFGFSNLANHSSSPTINLLPLKAPAVANAFTLTNNQVEVIKPTSAPPPAPVKNNSEHHKKKVEGFEASESCDEVSKATSGNAVVARPRSLALPTNSSAPQEQPPSVGKQITLPSACNLASTYVKLKTTDHSGLSTNTILHINNSHLASSNSNNKSVISSGQLSGNQQQAEPVLSFCGDNVIVGTGSLLVRRNKQLRIKFDEQTTATFEYLSEEALSDQFECSTRQMTQTGLLPQLILESNQDNNYSSSSTAQEASESTSKSTTTESEASFEERQQEQEDKEGIEDDQKRDKSRLATPKRKCYPILQRSTDDDDHLHEKPPSNELMRLKQA